MAKGSTTTNPLLDRMLKASVGKNSSLLSESTFFNDRDVIPTQVPAINIALGGALDGGLTSGITLISGESRHFKSNFGLVMVRGYLEKYPDAVCLFYDSEFGAPPAYLESAGVDINRVVHIPTENLDFFLHDIVKKLDEINRGDKVIVFMDSLGNLASIKEITDAEEEKGTQDLTRARKLKSIFRIITPKLTMLDIPMIGIAHVYNEMGSTHPKKIVSGGQGMMLAANCVFIVTRAQEKDGTELTGYKFTLNIEKSRFVKEKSKIPITVSFDGGINRWSGLFEIAEEGGFIKSPTMGWYQRINPATGEILDSSKWRFKDTNSSEFWDPILKNPAFPEFVSRTYKISNGSLLREEEVSTGGSE